MSLFVRIFLAVAAGLLALVVFAFVLKLLVIAALVAAVVVAVVFVISAFRRRLPRQGAYPMRRL